VPPLCGRLEVGSKSPVASDEKSTSAVELICESEVISHHQGVDKGETSCSGIEWRVVRRATKA